MEKQGAMKFSTVSLFDQALQKSKKPFKLWKKPSKSQSFQLEGEKILLKAPLGKRSKSVRTKIDQRLFFLTPNFLYYKKSKYSEKISGFLTLDWTRVVPTFNDDASINEDYPYKITLVKNLKFTNLYFSTLQLEDFKNWVQKLKITNILLTNFGEQFQLLELKEKNRLFEVRSKLIFKSIFWSKKKNQEKILWPKYSKEKKSKIRV